MSNAAGTIGQYGGSGTVIVDGIGSKWTNGDTLFVGEQGTGALTITGGGVVIAPEVHVSPDGYVANMRGVITIGGRQGGVAQAPGTLDTPIIYLHPTGMLDFDHDAADYIFAPEIRADGVVRQLSGTTILTADSSDFFGDVAVMGGELRVDGSLAGAGVLVSGGTLSGSGSVGGVLVDTGGTLAGVAGATLAIDNMRLTSEANIDVALGAPSAAALFDVATDMMLDGTLNVRDAGGFGSGLYRLFDYGGTLYDNGLSVGATPTGYAASDLTVQTSVANQVNLLVGTPLPPASYSFWDGASGGADNSVNGGGGTWSASGTNWTNVSGGANGAYDPAAMLIFQGAPGTVTVDAGGGALDVTGGMQFFVDGYRVEGGPLKLTAAATPIRVGDGTTAGAAMTATIASVLTGGGIAKTDLGTLTLTGANSYTGGTAVNAGTLIAGATSALGSGSVSVTGANLEVLSGVVLHNMVVLADNGPVGSTLVNRGLLSIAGGTLVSVTGSASSVTNHGTIRSAVNVNGDPAATGVSLNGGATLTNHGFITGLGLFPNAGVGVSLSGGSTLVNNGGHIEGTERGVTLNGVGNSVINAAGARITGDRKGITNSGGGVTLVNAGRITGDVELIGAAANAVTLVSGGRIEGQLEMGSNTASTLTLDGTGSQLYSAAVTGFTGFDGTLIKTGTGSWTIDKALTPVSVSVNAGTLVAGASGVLGSGSVNVRGANLEVLSGVVLHNMVVLADNGPVGSTLVNRGLLSIAGGTLVSVTGSASSVTNHGTIRSAVNVNGDPAATGVSLNGGATLTNHGFITGLGLFPNAGVGVSLSGGSTLVNNGGHIEGTERGVTLNGVGNSVINAAGARITGDRKGITNSGGGVTLVNAGRITGDVELIGAAANAVTLVSGGRIEGQLEMGSNTASTLTLDGTGNQLYSAAVTGFTGFDGTLTKTGTGSWTIDKVLTPGSVSVEAGTLAVTSTLTSPSVSVNGTGVLTGSGSIAGAVSVGNGGTLRGASGATLTMSSLSLAADAHIDVALGAPSTSALFDVTGNLTLDGTLNVTDAGSFGNGVYRLFSYGGTLTDNGLNVAAIPGGSGGTVQTATANQVNLLVGATNIFWNGSTPATGTIVGGSGIWKRTGSNWTDATGTVPLPWQGGFAVFQGQPGTVTVDDSDGPIDVTGMQFIGQGWVLDGDSITLAGPDNSTVMRVGDGTAQGVSHVATIGSGLKGGGALVKEDFGKLILTGDSSSFTGTTTIGQGTLAVNGVLGGALDLLAGARLQGTGTVGNLIVRGIIAPGNSIGTLNVAGNIGFAAGSTYEVEANAAGQSDKIVATGNAAISGGTVTVLAEAGNYQPQTDYTILTAAGGVTGTFADVTSNLAFLDPSLRYDAGHVYLRLTRNDISFAGIGLTPNQVAAGEATEALGWGRPVFEAVVNRSASQARDAFDQLSGEIHPSARMAMIEDSQLVRNAVWDRQRAGVGEDGRGLWGQALGNWGHRSGNGNAARLDRSTGGLLMGIDAAAGEDVRVGAVWGYSRTSIDVDQRGSSGQIDSYHLGAYAGGQWGGFALRTGLAYSWSDLHTTRTIAFPGFADRTQASYHGGTFQAFGEAAYGVDLGKTSVEPFASLAYVRARTNAVTETGGGAGLSGAKAATAVTVSTLGLRAATRFDVGGANATLRVGAGWRHAFGDAAPITAMRYQAGGNAFAIAGLPVMRDAVAFDAGLDVAVSDRTSIGISYNGQIGKGLSDQAAKASIRFRF